MHYFSDDEIATDNILQFFDFDHLPMHLQRVSEPFAQMAETILTTSDRCPERTVALRKLLESKDAAVRAAISSPPA